MNNLASVLTHRGNYEQAEEIHGQALGLRETALGKENPDALTSMNNLALVLRDQGIYTLTRHYWSQLPFRQPVRYFPS
jgi:hypothetical protein